MKKILFISLPLILCARELPIIECKNHNIIDIDKLKSERLISPYGQGSEFYFKLKQNTQKVFIVERPRTMQISEDLIKAFRISASIFTNKKSSQKRLNNSDIQECILYKQGLKRASVRLITIDNQKNAIFYNFKVGAIEHLYLTADMPVTSIKELSYNKDSDSIEETKKPSTFYLGINYKLGDIYTYYPIDEFYNDLSLKAMIKVSDKPTESMGLGLGYHLTEGIDIFVAKIWTQNCSISEVNSGHTATTVYGVSFDLNKGLEWVHNIYQ